MLTGLLLSLSLIHGCRLPVPEQSIGVMPDRLVLRDPSEVLNFVGVWVTLEGEVSRSKIAQINGVDINADFDGRDMRGRYAQASGILETWTVTQDQLDRAYADNRGFVNRGPGQFFRLVQPGNQKRLAVAIPLDGSSL
ncbi:MAG: hypothetical protein AAF911_08275 [Planctomycetota bacterium]